MARYYVDTNIWLDFLESRSSFLKPYNEFAFQFFKRCLEKGWEVIYSDFVLDELKEENSSLVEKHCFGLLREEGLLCYVEMTGREVREAYAISRSRRVPKGDALHAILARDNKAAVITRDKHFNLLQDIVKSFTPEDVF